jgi:hypothetical protein
MRWGVIKVVEHHRKANERRDGCIVDRFVKNREAKRNSVLKSSNVFFM